MYPQDQQMMTDLAKMFVHCLNHWKLETPSARTIHSNVDDSSAYKVNYTRSVFCKFKKLYFNILSCLVNS